MKRSILVLTVAAVLAITGGAFAAGQITGSQIKNSTITGKDVKNKSLTRKDFRGSVQGPQGPQGPQGIGGPQGPAGPTVVGHITYYSGDFTMTDVIDSATLDCPAGQRLVSGGYFVDSGYAFIDKTYDGASWTVGIDNSSGVSAAQGTITISCAPAGQAIAAKRVSHTRRNARIARDVAKR